MTWEIWFISRRESRIVGYAASRFSAIVAMESEQHRIKKHGWKEICTDFYSLDDGHPPQDKPTILLERRRWLIWRERALITAKPVTGLYGPSYRGR